MKLFSFQTPFHRLLRLFTIMVAVLSLCPAESEAAQRRQKKVVEVDTTVFTRKDAELQEVVVRPKKEKYSKKNNLAVDLMQRIRHSNHLGNPEGEPWYSYDKYDKIVLGLNDFEAEFGKAKGKWSFLNEYTDTAPQTGKQILNLSLKEKLSTVIWRDSPRARKQVERGVRSVGIDEAFEQQNIRKMLDDALREINIYSNDIALMQNRFVSPLSNIAADYYKFFITDTLDVDGLRCVELSFSPKNPESFSFNGKLYVDVADSACFIKKVTMRVPRVLNLNFVDNIFITQMFERDSIGKRHKVLDDMSLELQLIPGTPSFYGRRLSTYNKFSYSPREDMEEYYDRMAFNIQMPGSEERDSVFWHDNRPLALTRQEVKMDRMLKHMRANPVFYIGEKLIRIAAKGYVGTSLHGKPSKFDIGPVLSSISFGDVQGLRLRLGGVTTAALNPHWFGRGYLAYGFKDRKLKYRLEGEYSFNAKKRHSREFPVNSIRLSHEYDVFKIGQNYVQTASDAIFLSIARMKSILVTYRRLSVAEYNLELENNFSFGLQLRHEIQEATPWVEFRKSDGSFASRFSQSSFKVSLRYAPGEVFTQGVYNRAPINMDAPIFTLTHEYGPKGLFGAPFGINRTEASAFKRIWFSSFGYLDVLAKGGILWNAVPYTSLLWANANVSYTLQRETFSLLNPMEFAADKYVSLDMTYWMNGLIFNRIPLIKKLKLREVITFKGYLGGLSAKNDPARNPDLYSFPADALCRQMHGRPYLEIGAGIDNIARIFRLDYVWRLTYRDTPCAPNSGLRASLHFSF